MDGTIKRLVSDRGFGFIATSVGEDIFFHRSSVVGSAFEQLAPGQRVTFEERETPKGRRAENVRVR
jgi:CspA family cold shock protein